MEKPLEKLEVAQLQAAILELQLNGERLELLRLQSEEEKRKRPVLETRVHGLINSLHEKYGLKQLANIDLERGVIVIKDEDYIKRVS